MLRSPAAWVGRLLSGTARKAGRPLTPFRYAPAPHRRRHAPRGYGDYGSYKPWLRDEFAFRCAFCLVRERWYPDGSKSFGIDHLQPRQRAPHLICAYENLVYSCPTCNAAKQDAWPILDPCRVAYGAHLRVHDDGTIDGLTPDGRRLIDILRLDSPSRTTFRAKQLALVRYLTSKPASDRWAARLLGDLLAFPDDLPDLADLRPPGGNDRPEGIAESCAARRAQGDLPALYD